MKSRRISLPMRLLSFALGWCLAAVSLVAQEAPLGEVALPLSAIVVDLTAATVRIVSGDTEEPEVRWWRERRDEPGSDGLAVTGNAGSIVIERPALEEGDTFARLLVEVIMPADQQIGVFGSGLDLTIERELIGEVKPLTLKVAGVAVPQALVELQLLDSQVSLIRVGPVTATLDGCVVDMRQTTGIHKFQVIDSELRFIAHAGTITLSAQGAEVVAEDIKGQFSYQGTGGSIELRSSQGRFNLRAEGAQVQLLDWRGTGIVSVTYSNVDLRSSVFQSLNFKGVSSHATVSNCGGTTSVDLSGGSLTADGGTGKLTGIIRGAASIELTEHRGDIRLNLQRDSSADLSAIHGEVNITAHGARLVVDDARGLSLTADDSWAALSAIAKLKSFRATRSEIDLDLSDCQDRNPRVSVEAESYVRILLRTPCRVQAKGVVASSASQVDVTGCEFRVGQGRKWATRNVRGVDGQAPVILIAQVAADAELIVEGRP